jgi:hypothetical protein
LADVAAWLDRHDPGCALILSDCLSDGAHDAAAACLYDVARDLAPPDESGRAHLRLAHHPRSPRPHQRIPSAIHAITEPLRIIFTENAIIVGLLQLFMPLMVLALVSAMENIPSDVEEAARSLGRTGYRLLRVILPLSPMGWFLAALVFTGSITAYVTPAILGGTRVLMLATLLQQRAIVLLDWEGATIIAVVMIATTLIINAILRTLRPKMI